MNKRHGIRVAALVLGGALLLWIFSPAFSGYHIGDCSQTDYSLGAQAVGVPTYDGRAQPLTRLFRWCKPDTSPADYAGLSNTQTNTSTAVTCPDGSTATAMAACPAGPSEPACPVQSGTVCQISTGQQCPPGWLPAADRPICTAPSTSTNTVPIASPSKPIQVDCPLQDGGNRVLNNRNPTACFWGVGPGTGAEQNPPPNPHDGAAYPVDVGETCTWHDRGENALRTVEIYQCR